MASPRLDPVQVRERASAARARSEQSRQQLHWLFARSRRELRRANALVAEAEPARGRGLHWEEPDIELERVLVPLDGGQPDPIRSG
jgi:hypothetical protein